MKEIKARPKYQKEWAPCEHCGKYLLVWEGDPAICDRCLRYGRV